MYIRDIITKKRQNNTLTEEEIKFVIQAYYKDEITDAQMGALMTSMHISGLNENEIFYLVNAMAETGEELEFYKISNKITDIHTLGGISDKVIITVLSIINSLGYPALKVIGRELGMEDRLLAIPNYKIEENVDNIKKNIEEQGIGILRSIKNLAPVENKLYKLRHEVACDNDMELIATSIMSQKKALGFYNIFFEITYGHNAYVKNINDAKLLAKYLANIGKKEMRNVGCCITPLNEPVGKTFGNMLELREINQFLSGDENPELEEAAVNFAANILIISNFSNDFKKIKSKILDSIKNGEALKSFEKLITSGGGNVEVLKNNLDVNNKVPVMANLEGYVSEIDVNELRELAKYISAIRKQEQDHLDMGAGIILNKKVGDFVKQGEILGYIYTNDDTCIEDAVRRLKSLYKLQDKKIKDTSRVTYNITNL